MAEAREGRELTDFVAKLIALRQEHTALRSRHFLHGQSELAPGVFDIAWFEASGELVPEDVLEKSGDTACSACAAPCRTRTARSRCWRCSSIPTAEDQRFTLPRTAAARHRILIDTARARSCSDALIS